jgi:glycosyltransferase involved in cell wall biosynthesis
MKTKGDNIKGLYFFILLLSFGILLFALIPLLWFKILWAERVILIIYLLIIICFSGFLYHLLIIASRKKTVDYYYSPICVKEKITVALTAYNDELSIYSAIKDFSAHPRVKRVIVVSNNSTDKTIEESLRGGALVFNEEKQGYGACVYRALSESVKYNDTNLTLLCEGDLTFKAYDIEKFLAYLPHGDIVNGTRIVEQLRNRNTQLTNFMFYGNFFVGKLLELKHLSKGTFTDVGTTYKLCRNDSLNKLLPQLDNSINLEFNPYFMDMALKNNLRLIECPITFHPRVGKSKGGNINNKVAFRLGLRMIRGIVWKWG